MLSMLSQSLHRSLIYWQPGNTEEGKDGSIWNKYSVIHRLSYCFGCGAEGEGGVYSGRCSSSAREIFSSIYTPEWCCHLYLLREASRMINTNLCWSLKMSWTWWRREGGKARRPRVTSGPPLQPSGCTWRAAPDSAHWRWGQKETNYYAFC